MGFSYSVVIRVLSLFSYSVVIRVLSLKINSFRTVFMGELDGKVY